MVDRTPALDEVRRWFAEDLRAICHLCDERVVAAVAAVPRERFVGPGRWRIRHLIDGYWTTPDDDPRRLYHDVLVALDETHGLNSGEPALWALHFDELGIVDGSRVLRTGAGASCADTSHRIDGGWDVIVAFAGAATPLAWWLDSLADHGRFLLPMTANRERGGFMLRLQRNSGGLSARSAGWVGFHPCAGARSSADEVALRSLRRDPHDADESCWRHGDGWWLSRRELH